MSRQIPSPPHDWYSPKCCRSIAAGSTSVQRRLFAIHVPEVRNASLWSSFGRSSGKECVFHLKGWDHGKRRQQRFAGSRNSKSYSRPAQRSPAQTNTLRCSQSFTRRRASASSFPLSELLSGRIFLSPRQGFQPEPSCGEGRKGAGRESFRIRKAALAPPSHTG